MFPKQSIADLAVFGGAKLFVTPKPTSNFLRPDFDKFLNYSKLFFNQQRYSNNGPNVRLLEKRLAEFHQTDFCVTFCSGFWALVLAIKELALRGKTEVIIPSLTYRRLADITAWVNLKPHFCEVEQTTLAMSTETVRPCINESTALILGVHPIVNCCDVKGLVSLAKEKDIPLLFDSVESVYESTAEGKVGCFGNAEVFSLHASKLLNGFEGGYLTTNDADLAKALKATRSFGFSEMGTVEMAGGMNAKLNEIHASMALASLDSMEEMLKHNYQIYYTYKRSLAGIPGVRLLEFDENNKSGFKNIVVELLDEWPLSRAETIDVLNEENILARAYYSPPLHSKKMSYQYVKKDLPLTDVLAERFLNLPCGQHVTTGDISNITELLNFIYTNAGSISKLLYRSRLNKNEDN